MALLCVVLVSFLTSYPTHAEWVTYSEGLVRADSTQTLILVEVYTDWCAFCKKLERRVLSREDVKSVLEKHYTTVKLDAEDETPLARIGDQTLDGRTLARKYGATTFPTCLILSSNGRLLKKLVGYPPPRISSPSSDPHSQRQPSSAAKTL